MPPMGLIMLLSEPTTFLDLAGDAAEQVDASPLA